MSDEREIEDAVVKFRKSLADVNFAGIEHCEEMFELSTYVVTKIMEMGNDKENLDQNLLVAFVSGLIDMHLDMLAEAEGATNGDICETVRVYSYMLSTLASKYITLISTRNPPHHAIP